MKRLQRLKQQLDRSDRKDKLSWFKKDGWGYKDTEFIVDKDGVVQLTGNRYQFAGQKLSKFKQWAEKEIGIDINKPRAQSHHKKEYAEPFINQSFIIFLKQSRIQFTLDKNIRILHSHGHALQQIFLLKEKELQKIVDIVIFLGSHQQAQKIVSQAIKHNIVLCPYGGGTNVTQALSPNKQQTRMIASIDMSKMNRVKWVQKKSMCACVEAGIIGKDLQRQLLKHGFTCGHEPDSVQFSSLGGWISTRASGMKKNRYGNIDDIVLNVKIVTPIGTFTKLQNVPRMSSGPDITQLIMGHQGNLGIITQAIIKLRPVPKIKIYDSVIFHDFDLGTDFMYDVALSKMWPASIRTVDNKQFKFGMALKIDAKDKLHEVMDKAKKYFVTQVMKFDQDRMTLCTIVFEGNQNQVAGQQKVVYSLVKKYKGFRAGAQNGERGYFLTFVIGYLRDFALKYGFIAESFETSISWKDVAKLCKNVKRRIQTDCRKYNLAKQPFISFRVTQVYDYGAAVYVYFGFLYNNLADPIATYTQIQDGARDEIMKCGGSISHHHGIGKLRKKFLGNSIGDTGLKILQGMKKIIDPHNIFASGNLI